MSRTIITIFSLASAALVGCGAEGAYDETQTEFESISEAETPAPFTIGEEATIETPPPVSEATLVDTPDGDTFKSCATGRMDTSTAAKLNLGGGNFPSGSTYDQCAHYCPAGSYAYGIHLRAQASQGNNDDRAITSLALHCNDPSTGEFKGWVTSQTDTTGEWRGNPATCPTSGTPLTKGRIKYKSPGGDDVGTTHMQGWCSDGTKLSPATAPNTDTGSWLSTKSCPSGEVVCGINVGNNAVDGNDQVAADQVELRCCTL